ncbi:hypothetical protein E4O03_04055 [Treponema sp. OMZ 792]|uniref:hypothetical protein n=1 Tax=unclassified Treponema TaxID=2638727 RepID=UPI0020A45360|nr:MULTISPECIES: hypothetical protein [unclassified Treponema]UTC75895.1 hypothetical protein E4O03_04055 [Treponema sp. OMZ 792]UTC79895.1 hypothetical protein E4O07_04070 [Treponema sp. OMZ 798]
MKSVYKARPYRVFLNLLFGLGAAIFVTAIASFFVKSTVAGFLLFIVVFAAYVWFIIINNLITIELDGRTLLIKTGKKTEKYDIDKTSIRAVTKTSRGETSCKLYLTKEGGTEELVDCELIGITKFMELLEELGLGETVAKLNTSHQKDLE